MNKRLKKRGGLAFAVAALSAAAMFAAPAELLAAEPVSGEAGDVGETQPLVATEATAEATVDGETLRLGEATSDAGAQLMSSEAGEGEDVGAAALKTLGALGLVAMAILATRYWLQRQGLRRAKVGSAGTLLETIETLPLGPQRQVLALRFRDQLLLVGEGPAGMTLLSQQPLELPESADVAGDQPTAQQPPEAAQPRTLSRSDLLGLMARQDDVTHEMHESDGAAHVAAFDESTAGDEVRAEIADGEAAVLPEGDADAAVQSRDDIDALLIRLRTQRQQQGVGV